MNSGRSRAYSDTGHCPPTGTATLSILSFLADVAAFIFDGSVLTTSFNKVRWLNLT